MPFIASVELNHPSTPSFEMMLSQADVLHYDIVHSLPLDSRTMLSSLDVWIDEDDEGDAIGKCELAFNDLLDEGMIESYQIMNMNNSNVL